MHVLMGVNRLFFFILLFEEVWNYIEYVEEHGCESCALRLTCRHLNSIITVLEANFEESTPKNSILPTAFPPINPRAALNKRCSGLNHCSFILIKDCPGADKWGFGNLTIKYACIAERRITRYCNLEIELPAPETLGISQGFIHNPGYPRFYLGKQECRWKIRAPPLQKVKVVLFDISLVGDPNKESCSDAVEVSDRDQILYSTCEQQEPPIEVISLGDSLDITLVPSRIENVVPSRGVLFYYTAVGCPTPSAPKDGYLVYRNDTAAVFRCCVGFAFPDTRSRSRVIKCLGHRWDIELPFPDCGSTTSLILDTDTVTFSTTTKYTKMVETNSLEEIIIPSIVMVGLFLINSLVLFIIYKYRQRKVSDFTAEELGVLPTNTKMVS